MAVFPLISNVNKGPDAKSLAIVEALVLIPTLGVVLGYGAGILSNQYKFDPWVGRAAVYLVVLLLAKPYVGFISKK
jgi:hypothetical protein